MSTRERGDDAQDCRAARRAARGGGSGAPEAGEDGAEKEEGEEADVRSMGIREPRRSGRVGEEAARVPGADGGGPTAWRGARVSADFGTPAAARILWGRGRGVPRKAESGG
jgi:hypothetical protein